MKTSLVLAVGIIAVLGLGGCAAFEPLTSDETILNDTASLLGVAPADLKITDRRAEGGSSYYTATTKNGVVYGCVIEGGTVITFGMHNPPVCQKKGS